MPWRIQPLEQGPLFGGQTLDAMDAEFMPELHHAIVELKHFKVKIQTTSLAHICVENSRTAQNNCYSILVPWGFRWLAVHLLSCLPLLSGDDSFHRCFVA